MTKFDRTRAIPPHADPSPAANLPLAGRSKKRSFFGWGELAAYPHPRLSELEIRVPPHKGEATFG